MNAAAVPPPLPPAPRSTLVNATAWIAGCLCAVGLLALAFEVGFYALVSGTPAFAAFVRELGADPQTAAFVAAASRWLPWLVALALLECVVGLVASIGLIRRREWARRTFVGLLAFAAVWQCAMIPAQRPLNDAIRALTMKMLGAASGPQAQQLRAQLEASLSASYLTGAVIGVLFLGVYAWLAWTLCTPRIRREFAPRTAANGVVSL